MKNSNLFLLVAALFAFVSCGTANLTAQWGASQYRNGIYYSTTAASNVQAAPVQQYVEYAQAQPEQVVPASVALAEGESYEERLRKFDSPVYVVNVEYVDLYPWWTLDFAWSSHSWRWYHSWYARPYWYDYHWYNHHWYDHYWYGHHWYHDYWHGHHHWYPHYGHIHYPSHHRPHQPARPVYYGKRDYTPSYRDVNRGYVSTGSKSPMGNPSGSVTRRTAGTRSNTAVVNGQPAGQQRPQGVQQGQQGKPQYRRTVGNSSSGNVKSAPASKKENASSASQQQKQQVQQKKEQVNRDQQNRNSQNEYRRSSSSQSYQNNRSSSYSSGRSSYSNGGGGSRSSGSASGSYRRR
ncbi:MAG: hypothetical protein J6Q34_02795 [Bacteroidales bacterium]|nr:hypothetical protein [Bacteroidales bacterium]